MNIWSTEIKELNQIYQMVKGKLPKLEKELSKLVTMDDENMLLVYSRRCLEVIITDLCERELKRHRGTEPLQRIIDKLNKEEIVPQNIIVSMQGVNSMSTFGAHPKDFELEQVKPVLHNLKTIIKWYLKYKENQESEILGSGVSEEKKQFSPIKSKSKSARKIGLISGLLLIAIIISIVAIKIFNIKGEGLTTKSGTIGSIVVLPFSNFTGQDSMEWLVDGMHASLIQDMGKVSSLHIPGTTTSLTYKNSNKTINEITSERNADAALETAVLCLGEDSICFQTRLIKSGTEEEQLWTADYKIARDQIQNWYNGVTKQIAKEISIEITPQEMQLLSDNKLVNKEAYDAYLKGQYYWEKLDATSMQKALNCFELATQLEPDWADPYAGLANAWGLFGLFEVLPKSVTLPQKYKYINKALELNPNSAKAHYVKAINAVWTEWDWEQGEKEFLKTLELNPNDALAHLYYAHLLMILHRTDEAVHQANLGLELDPLKPIVLSLYAIVMENEGDYKTSLFYLNKALSIDPDFTFANGNLLPALFYEGEYEKWIKVWEKKVRQNGHWNEEAISNVVDAFHERGHISAIEEMFKMNEKYGDNGAFMSEGIKLIRYLHVNNFEKALDCIEKSSDLKNLETAYFGTNLYKSNKLKEYPRYIELLKKMNLPSPKK